MNSAWIPPDTFSNWRFSISNSGWTSDSHGYKWLIIVFKLNTRPQYPTQRRLFIINNYSSHITTNFITFCMEYLIDLFILLSHTLHLLQPLDVGVFMPLKYILVKKTDIISRLNYSRILYVN